MKNINKSFIPAVIVLALVSYLNHLGNNYHLYIRIPPYDIMMHILGGLGIALAVYWAWSTYLGKPVPKKWLWTIVIITLIAGLAWERMEWIYNIAGYKLGSLPYWLDTIKDLIDDTLGAIFAYVYVKNLK